MITRCIILLMAALLPLLGMGQRDGYVSIDGHYLPYRVDENGDTLLLAQLRDITVSAPRLFDDPDDMSRYRKYKRYALKVYPYALKAIRIYREIDVVTHDMVRRHRKKYIRALHQELKDEFTDPLKKMSRTQGMILIKMVENELDTPIYHVIKELRGGLTARYWSTMGIFFGHHLEQGYEKGEDPVLDAVLYDLPVQYFVPDQFETHFEEGTPFKVRKRWIRKEKRMRKQEERKNRNAPQPDS